MAVGDIVVFEEAKAYMMDGGWEAADEIWVGLTSSTPTAADAIPAFISGGTTNYTECTPVGGNYSTGGYLLDTWGNCITEAAGVVTFDDTGASVTWAAHASNPTNPRYAIIYNTTDTANRAICYVDLGAVIDMTAGALTITWPGSGIFTFT